MAGDAAGKRELFEQFSESSLVLRDLGVDFAVCPFQIRVAHDRGSTMSGAGDVDHVQIEVLNHTIQMHIDKVLSRSGPPMAEQVRLDMRSLQWLVEQWVVVQINLANRQIVRSSPIGIHLAKEILGELAGSPFCDCTHLWFRSV